ncbi:MAG TPA: M1 family aminopeptidase [Geobacteraceae bacterium]
MSHGFRYSFHMIVKAVAAILVLILSPLFLSACSAGEPPLPLGQDIAVTLVPESHEMAGESTLVIRPRGAATISFTLAPAATVMRCAVAGKPAPFTFRDGVLRVELPAASGDGPLGLVISYRCAFDDRPPADAASGEDPTYGVKGAVSPRGVFLGPDAGWYPTPELMPQRRSVRVTAPAGMEAITAGSRISRATADGATVSLWEEARPAVDLALSAGPYLVGEGKVDDIPIYTYFLKDDADLAGRYLEASVRYIRFYRELFGPYPFEKFAVVENFFPTGYGFPSYTLLGGTVIRLPFIPDTSLPHEIAHSWWGNGVLVDYDKGNWSEGLAVYSADYLLQERKSAAAGRDYRLRILADYASLVTTDRDFPLVRFTGRVDPASRSIGYGKGAMVFHTIRRMMGDEAFFQALRDVCREKLFKRASWDDFLGAFAKRSGRDFTAFRQEWLERSGGPHLSLARASMRPSGKEWAVSGEVVQSSPVYHLDLQLEVEYAGNDVIKTVKIAGERTPFNFTVPAEPRRLLLDPDAEVFRILSPDEIPLTVNRIKGSKSLLVVTTPDCHADRATLELLLESLDQAGAQMIAEDEADPSRLKGHDLLFCGPPQRLPLPMSASVSVSAGGFAINGKPFNHEGDALLLVGQNLGDPERVAALFFPLSKEAARKCAAKITHYGSYGYLVFSAGVNREKGLVPASSPASVITFDHGDGL